MSISCCLCKFPVQMYCEDCYQKHLSNCREDLAFHYRLSLSAQSIHSIGDFRGLKIALNELKDYKINITKAFAELATAKETLGKFFDELVYRVRKYEYKITQKDNEISRNLSDSVTIASEKVIGNPSAASEEMKLFSDFFAEAIASIDEILQCSRNCIVEASAKAMEATVAIVFPEEQPRIDLALCLPSGKPLGVFTFALETRVSEVKMKIGELEGFTRFDLMHGDTVLRPRAVLGLHHLPQLALITVSPIVTARSDGQTQDYNISDTDIVSSLKAKLTHHGQPLGPTHHLICNNQVLDDDFLLMCAGSDSVFDIIECERPDLMVFIRDETYLIYKVPFQGGDESVIHLKQRFDAIIRCDIGCQSLSYCLQLLHDEEILSERDITPGSVIDLEHLVLISVHIPAISVPFRIEMPSKSATVLETKLKITELIGLPPGNQFILLKGLEMQEKEPLNPNYKSKITVTLHMKGYLLASHRENQYLAIEFQGGDEVTEQLKIRISEKLNMNVKTLELIYNGKKLIDFATLASAGVTEGCLITVFSEV